MGQSQSRATSQLPRFTARLMHLLTSTQLAPIGIQMRRRVTSSINTLPAPITGQACLMEPVHTIPTQAIHLVYQMEPIITLQHMRLNQLLHNLPQQSHLEVSKNFSTIQSKSPIPLSWRKESNRTESSGDLSLRAISLTKVSPLSVRERQWNVYANLVSVPSS